MDNTSDNSIARIVISFVDTVTPQAQTIQHDGKDYTCYSYPFDVLIGELTLPYKKARSVRRLGLRWIESSQDNP